MNTRVFFPPSVSSPSLFPTLMLEKYLNLNNKQELVKKKLHLYSPQIKFKSPVKLKVADDLHISMCVINLCKERF